MRCRLCRKETERLAKSHIVPLGFFPKGGRLLYTAGGDGTSRKLANALWDQEILCDECEHEMLAPLDEYAIRILRDKDDSVCWHGEDVEIRVYQNIDRRKMRSFWASLLWRFSVSMLSECDKVNVGSVYEDLIASDLLHSGDFRYVDVVVYNLLNELHGGIMTPTRTRLSYGNQFGVNGYSFNIPHFDVLMSLDQRPHPCAAQHWNIDLDGKSVAVTMSLSDAQANVPYGIPVVDTIPHEVDKIKTVFASYAKNTKHLRKIPRNIA